MAVFSLRSIYAVSWERATRHALVGFGLVRVATDAILLPDAALREPVMVRDERATAEPGQARS
jgi:hypothetical protein